MCTFLILEIHKKPRSIGGVFISDGTILLPASSDFAQGIIEGYVHLFTRIKDVLWIENSLSLLE